jgi:hypothetical protein
MKRVEMLDPRPEEHEDQYNMFDLKKESKKIQKLSLKMPVNDRTEFLFPISR